MRLHNKGQSVLEYVLLATIVIIGIIIGGPLLLKSVQGYFKLTDETVQDATSENITSAPVTGIAAPNCKCSTTTNAVPSPLTLDALDAAGWSKGVCGVGLHDATQRYYYRTCSPMKCAQEEIWLSDPTCCTDAKPVGCGTKFSPNTPNATGRQLCGSTAPLNGNFTEAENLTGTCAVIGNDYDCPIGQRLYMKECAHKPAAGDSTTPPKTDKFYACSKPDDTAVNLDCLPSCWQYPYPHSKPCNPNEQDQTAINENSLTENDDVTSIIQRKALIPEVAFRLSNGNANPHRILTRNVEPSDSLKYNANRNHFVYLKASQCSANRFCERTCPGGYAPNTEGSKGLHANETCEQMACWYGWWPETLATPPKTTNSPGQKLCASAEDPKICSTSDNICGSFGVCLDAAGAICYQAVYGNVLSVRKLSSTTSDCNEDEKKVTDRNGNNAFCYKIDPNASALSPKTPSRFECNNKDLYFTVIGCES